MNVLTRSLIIIRNKSTVWDLHLQEGLCQTVEHLLLLLPLEVCPEGLVLSYTSLDRSERSIKVNDGVVRTISTTEFDSCSR